MSSRKHRKSITRIKLTKKKNKTSDDNKETQEDLSESKDIINPDDITEDNKRFTEDKDMGKIYKSFVTILKKGDNVQRKESKKKLLDILNSIEDIDSDDNVKDDKESIPQESFEQKGEDTKKEEDVEMSKVIKTKRKGTKVIKMRKKIYLLLKEAFEMNNIKKKYFIRWKKNVNLEEKEEVTRKHRIISVKKVILKKGGKDNEIEIEEDKDTEEPENK